MLQRVIFLILLANSVTANAQMTASGFEEERDIYEKIYNAPLKIAGGHLTSIEALYQEKPLLMALVFTRCTGICTPFLFQLKQNLQFGKNYGTFNILVLSFDPNDTEEAMRLWAKKFGLDDDKRWFFSVTDSIDKLNQSVNFFPAWDSITKQFDHDALLVGINNEGFITKKLLGIRAGHDLDLLLGSMQNVFSPTYRLPGKSTLFSCFNYNPETGKNTLGFGLLFIALPSVLTVLILAFIRLFTLKNNATGW